MSEKMPIIVDGSRGVEEKAGLSEPQGGSDQREIIQPETPESIPELTPKQSRFFNFLRQHRLGVALGLSFSLHGGYMERDKVVAFADDTVEVSKEALSALGSLPKKAWHEMANWYHRNRIDTTQAEAFSRKAGEIMERSERGERQQLDWANLMPDIEFFSGGISVEEHEHEKAYIAAEYARIDALPRLPDELADMNSVLALQPPSGEGTSMLARADKQPVWCEGLAKWVLVMFRHRYPEKEIHMQQLLVEGKNKKAEPHLRAFMKVGDKTYALDGSEAYELTQNDFEGSVVTTPEELYLAPLVPHPRSQVVDKHEDFLAAERSKAALKSKAEDVALAEPPPREVTMRSRLQMASASSDTSIDQRDIVFRLKRVHRDKREPLEDPTAAQDKKLRKAFEDDKSFRFYRALSSGGHVQNTKDDFSWRVSGEPGELVVSHLPYQELMERIKDPEGYGWRERVFELNPNVLVVGKIPDWYSLRREGLAVVEVRPSTLGAKEIELVDRVGDVVLAGQNSCRFDNESAGVWECSAKEPRSVGEEVEKTVVWYDMNGMLQKKMLAKEGRYVSGGYISLAKNEAGIKKVSLSRLDENEPFASFLGERAFINSLTGLVSTDERRPNGDIKRLYTVDGKLLDDTLMGDITPNEPYTICPRKGSRGGYILNKEHQRIFEAPSGFIGEDVQNDGPFVFFTWSLGSNAHKKFYFIRVDGSVSQAYDHVRFEGALGVVMIGRKKYFIDDHENKLSDGYEYANVLPGGIRVARLNGKQVILDTYFQPISDGYKNISYAGFGHICIADEEVESGRTKKYLLDGKTGKRITQKPYRKISNFVYGRAIARDFEGGYNYLLDDKGNEIRQEVYNIIYGRDGDVASDAAEAVWWLMDAEGKFAYYIDKNGKKIF